MRLFGFDITRAPQPEPAPRVRPRMVGSHAAVRSLFNSGDSNRLTGDWPTFPVPADWIITRYQRALVARSREQAQNNDYVKAYLRLQRQNIVGPAGIILQSKAEDPDARRAIEAAFKDWGKRENCDITGKRSWRAMQAMCVHTEARDGEYFVRFIDGRQAGKYRVALQFLDPQRCPVEYDRFDLADGAFIRQGIEFNSYGRPIAYHFSDDSTERSSISYSYSGRGYMRVPAEDIVHGFEQLLPGQKRGLPWLDTGLFRAKQMGAMEDAAIVNARLGAAKMGVIRWDDGFGPEYDEEEDGPLEIDAEPGAIPVLPQGAHLEKYDPTYPSGELGPFVKLMLRGMAAGGGVAYENLSQDREGVTWTSIRQGTLDERENYKERQEHMVEELCDPVFTRVLERALLGGLVKTVSGLALPARLIDDYESHKWQPRRWDWVDPNSDTTAAKTMKDNLLASFSQLIRERGKDPEHVWQEIAEDIKAMQSAGIPYEFIVSSMNQKLAVAPAAPKDNAG